MAVRRSSYLRATAPPSNHVLPEGWRERAACRNHPTLTPDTWDDSISLRDTDRHESTAERATRIGLAVGVCKTCPVQEPCLRDVDLRYDEGVRGGIDLRELPRPKRKST